MRPFKPSDLALWEAAMAGVRHIVPRATINCEPRSKSLRRDFGSKSDLDLHGMTLQNAYQSVLERVDVTKDSHKSIVIITGKSGGIADEFPRWVETVQGVSRVEMLNGGGAFRLHFKKNRRDRR